MRTSAYFLVVEAVLIGLDHVAGGPIRAWFDTLPYGGMLLYFGGCGFIALVISTPDIRRWWRRRQKWSVVIDDDD